MSAYADGFHLWPTHAESAAPFDRVPPLETAARHQWTTQQIATRARNEGRLIWGTAEQVAAKLRALGDAYGTNEVMINLPVRPQHQWHRFEAHSVAEPVDPWRKREYPQKAGSERAPGGKACPKQTRDDRLERFGRMVYGKVSDELRHHDERAWRCLGKPQSIGNLARLQPAEALHRSLCHVDLQRLIVA